MSTETTWGIITLLVAALAGLAIYAVQERMERTVAEDKASHRLERHNEVDAEASHLSRSLAVERVHRVRAETELANARTDTDSLIEWERERWGRASLPTVTGPRDPEWVARGDSPAFDAALDTWGNKGDVA